MQASLESLFSRYRATGQPEALGEVFDRASPQLLAVALHLCGHPADAEDALQATFVAAIDHAARWHAQRPLLPWLCGILDKQCRRILQRRGRRRERELPAAPVSLDDGSPLAASERHELVARLREHVDRLPVEQRQVLLLQLEHGLAPAEIAEVLAVPPGTVRMRLHRGVQALRGVLPSSLVALLIAALPSRGIAAVRALVVGHAVAAVGVGGTAFFAKNFLAAGLLLVMAVGSVAIGWPWLVGSATPPPQLSSAPATADLASGETGRDGKASAPRRPRREAASEDVPRILPLSTRGSLRIVTRRESSRDRIANVPLSLFRVPSDVEARFSFLATATGPDGSVVLHDLAPGRLRAMSAASGPVEAVVRAGAETLLDVPLDEALDQPRWLRGRVLQADGAPAAGATVVVGPAYEGYAEPVARADAAGAFAIDIALPMVSIGARMRGHAPSHLLVSPAEGAELVLTLRGPEAVVEGLVLDSFGRPIVAANVEIGAPRRGGSWQQDGRYWSGAPPQRLRTGTDGRFVAEGLPPDDISVFVAADGHAPFHRFAALQAGVRTEVVCSLTAGIGVHGRVVDQRGEPVVDAKVRLGGSYGELRSTDDDGRFAYRHVAAGRPQVLLVEAEDLKPRQFERSADQTGEWRVVVERAASYRLRFVDEQSRPLEGWHVKIVSALERTATTDGEGRVVVAALGEAPFRLWFGAPDSGESTVPLAWPAAVPGVESTVVVPTATLPSGELRGRVVGADGAAWSGGWVSLRGAAGVLLLQPLTSPAFTLTRIPAGDWTLRLHREQIGCAALEVPIVALGHAEARELGTLQVPREGGLRVHAVRADGRSVTGADVYLSDGRGGETTVPADGQVHTVPAGHYRWQVMADDTLWQSGTLDVRAGEASSLDLLLRPGVRRSLVFPVPRPEWGEPTRVTFVVRAPDGSVYDEGAFDPREELPYRYVPAVAIGTWRVELTLDDGRFYGGAFTIDSLAPSRTPIELAVAPVR